MAMRKVLLCLLLAVAVSVSAQETKVLTLDECITMALQNNIDIKRAQNNALIAKSNNVQSLMELLPTITAGVNYDYFIGTTFDVNAAAQVTATTNSSNPNISGSWNLFNGMSNYNTRRQREKEFQSSQSNVENTILNTRANVLASYLNVVLSQENIKIAEERVDLLTSQLEREEKRESVGVGNLETVYNFRSQLATEKLNLNTLQNQYERNKLLLLQAMQLDPTAASYVVESIDVSDADLTEAADPFAEVLGQSLSYSPSIRAAEASKRASVFQLRSARGGLSPTISVFGRIGSNYSSNGAVNPDVEPGDSGRDNFEPDATYFEQIGYNQFEYVNFSLTIPLFNRFRTRNGIQTARLAMANAELDQYQAEVTVTNTVQTAYLDLIAAQNTYQSATENLQSLRQSFEFMKKRHETGNSDFYTYLESLNNKNRAEVQLANAKYSIVLRKRILELYRGQNQ